MPGQKRPGLVSSARHRVPRSVSLMGVYSAHSVVFVSMESRSFKGFDTVRTRWVVIARYGICAPMRVRPFGWQLHQIRCCCRFGATRTCYSAPTAPISC